VSASRPVGSLEDLVAIGLPARGHGPLARVRRVRSDYSTSAPIDEVTVELQDGSRLDLMAKKLGATARLDAARHAKPDFACSATREPALYSHLVDESGPPECWGTVDESDGPLLVLERIPGLALRHIGDLRLWQAAAVWLAGFHRRWRDLGGGNVPSGLRPHLLRYDRAHHMRLLARAKAFTTAAAAGLSPAFVEQHSRAVEILEKLPESLIHGEFYASNVIVDATTTPPRVAPIDWEMAGIGSPFLDLAALVSGEWEPEERQGIVDAYRSSSGLDVSQREFECALAAAELLISTQWMGWASGWEPPDDLAADWAVNAAGKAALLGRLGRDAPTTGERRLIVNADDLGLTEG